MKNEIHGRLSPVFPRWKIEAGFPGPEEDPPSGLCIRRQVEMSNLVRYFVESWRWLSDNIYPRLDLATKIAEAFGKGGGVEPTCRDIGEKQSNNLAELRVLGRGVPTMGREGEPIWLGEDARGLGLLVKKKFTPGSIGFCWMPRMF